MSSFVPPARKLATDRFNYPALNVAEILVWNEFRRLHQDEYDSLPSSWFASEQARGQQVLSPDGVFDYNVRIGSGRDPGPEFSPSIRQGAILNSMLRLDAVGFKGGAATIFEVKRYAGAPQVGQLVTYEAMWNDSGISPANPSLVLVAAGWQPNILPMLKKASITLVLVEVDFRALSPFGPPPTTTR